jgi:hypothetical protein
MSVSANDLMQACNAARDTGADFPTIWETVLKRHPLVATVPVQGTTDHGPVLEVPLITGQKILFQSTGFSIG